MTKRRPSPGSPKVAVAYLRASKEEQQLSPDAQRASIEAWAVREGVTVVAWFTEHLSSVTKLDERAEFLRAVDALVSNGAGVFVVAKRDRLARDVALAAAIEALVHRAGSIVASAAGEGEDNDNDPASLLMRRMVDVFAEYERALIKARTKAALAVKRARGEKTGGGVPYGFTLAADGVRLLPVEPEQAVISTARELRSSGLSLRDVASELAKRGVLSRQGTPFMGTQVARMVKSA